MAISEISRGYDDRGWLRCYNDGLPIRGASAWQSDTDKTLISMTYIGTSHLNGIARLVRKRPDPTGIAITEREFRIDRVGANTAVW
jgi:hypothetical protein